MSVKKKNELAGQELKSEDLADVAGGLAVPVVLDIPVDAIGRVALPGARLPTAARPHRRRRHHHRGPARAVTATVVPSVAPTAAVPRVAGTAPLLPAIFKPIK